MHYLTKEKKNALLDASNDFDILPRTVHCSTNLQIAKIHKIFFKKCYMLYHRGSKLCKLSHATHIIKWQSRSLYNPLGQIENTYYRYISFFAKEIMAISFALNFMSLS